MNFCIKGLPADEFTSLFSMSDEALAERGAVRLHATSSVPCRVSLTDAQAGAEVILTHYEHHRVQSPYRSSYAIYVRAGEESYNGINQVPEQLLKRTLSVRAYDDTGMIVDAELIDGNELENLAPKLLSIKHVAYLHVHYAKFGCYAALVEPVQETN